MAVTVTTLGAQPLSPHPPGSERWVLAKVAFDSSYPSGGYLVTAATFGLNRLDAVLVNGTTLAGRMATFLATTGAIKVYKAITTENDVADLSADSVQVTAIGV